MLIYRHRMKSFILFLFLLSPAIIKAQGIVLPVDTTEHQITYTEVVQVKGVPKELLYDRAREWFARYFNSAESDVRLDDFETGKLIVKSFVPYEKGGVYYHLLYTISLNIKPGRFRYELNDFQLQNTEMDDKKPVYAMYMNPDDIRDNGVRTGKNLKLYEKISETAATVSTALKKALSKPLSVGSDF